MSHTLSSTVTSGSTIPPSTTNVLTTTGPTTTDPTTTVPTTIAAPTTITVPTTTNDITNTATSTSRSSSRSSSTAKNGSTSPPEPSISSHRLANGTVAGIVIGVALGLALLTFLATFFLMRRQQKSKENRRPSSFKDSGGFETEQTRQQGPTSTAKRRLVAEPSSVSGTYENFLPQSADDKTIQQRTKEILDQIELHVENFYQSSSSSNHLPDITQLAVFDSPYLPASLASLFPRSKHKTNLIKHALAQSATSAISPSASPERSILPTEYGLLPNTIATAGSNVFTKAGSGQIMSRWRVLTAYLRPDPTKDATFIAQRDRRINDTVQSFARAFAPWKSAAYKDEIRAQSLSAILEDAATLGILLFSQPSSLQFHWPSSREVGLGRIVVSPALVKMTDEKGLDLVEVQVMTDKVVRDA